MSYRNKGSMPVTVFVTKEPDRSGNLVCDGTADDVEINQALALINASAEQCGRIILGRAPSSSPYDITAPLDIPDAVRVKIQGQGIGQTYLELANGINDSMWKWTPALTKVFVALEDMSCLGNKDNNASGNGLFASNVDGGTPGDLYVRDVIFSHFKESGIYTVSGWAHRFIHTICEVNDGRGYRISGGSQHYLAFPFSSANGEDGFFLSGDRCTITGARSYNNGHHGYYITGDKNQISESMSYSNNEDAGNYDGFYVTGDWNRLNVFCECDNAERYGVNLSASSQGNRIFATVTNPTTAIFNDIGTDNVLNNEGKEAAGIGVAPTAASWMYGEIVHNTSDDAFWIRDTAGIMRILCNKEVFMEVTDPDTNVGDHPALVLPDTVDTTLRFQFLAPMGLTELKRADVIVTQLTTAGPPNMQWSTTTDWGALCTEAYNAGSDAETDQTTAVTQNILTCIDVSGSLTGIAAGDLVGFTFIRRASQGGDTINADAYYLGFRLRYV